MPNNTILILRLKVRQCQSVQTPKETLPFAEAWVIWTTFWMISNATTVSSRPCAARPPLCPRRHKRRSRRRKRCRSRWRQWCKRRHGGRHSDLVEVGRATEIKIGVCINTQKIMVWEDLGVPTPNGGSKTQNLELHHGHYTDLYNIYCYDRCYRPKDGILDGL